jgi:threonine/homoserine/homoserine lactone efflux protein
MGLELIMFVVIVLLAGFIWLGYIGWKKRKERDQSGPDHKNKTP